MPDLRRRLAELDLLEPPDMVSDINRRIAERQVVATASPVHSPGVWWRGPLIAAGTAAAILTVVVGSLLLLGGDDSDVVDGPTPTTLAPPATTVPVMEPMSPIVEAWNPILTTTVAREAPAAATCPDGTNPDVPGPIEQVRPGTEGVGVVSAVFDQHAGRIVYVNALGETWTFDVCTNTWHHMHPTGTAPDHSFGGLVYDVDSDVTVALGPESVAVYNANSNTWTHPTNDRLGYGTNHITPYGAAYDPVTGLIITSNRRGTSETSADAPFSWEFWAYDVDTNEWTLLGPLRLEPSAWDFLELLGYSEQLDKLIVTGSVITRPWVEAETVTILVDPRTGDVTELPIDSPGVNMAWPSESYGAAGGTVYVTTFTMTTIPNDVCGFDADLGSWSACFGVPRTPETGFFRLPALVGDPINNRLLAINGISSAGTPISRVGAIDLATGEWTLLLAPATP